MSVMKSGSHEQHGEWVEAGETDGLYELALS